MGSLGPPSKLSTHRAQSLILGLATLPLSLGVHSDFSTRWKRTRSLETMRKVSPFKESPCAGAVEEGQPCFVSTAFQHRPALHKLRDSSALDQLGQRTFGTASLHGDEAWKPNLGCGRFADSPLSWHRLDSLNVILFADILGWSDLY